MGRLRKTIGDVIVRALLRGERRPTSFRVSAAVEAHDGWVLTGSKGSLITTTHLRHDSLLWIEIAEPAALYVERIQAREEPALTSRPARPVLAASGRVSVAPAGPPAPGPVIHALPWHSASPDSTPPEGSGLPTEIKDVGITKTPGGLEPVQMDTDHVKTGWQQ